MPDWLTAEQRSRNMAAIRSSGTSPEARLLAALKVTFPRRKIIERPRELPGKPDFYLPGFRLAIFADGCFWHGCPVHGRTPDDNQSYWVPKLARNKARDREAGRALRLLGIRPVRLWEHELAKAAIDGAVRKVVRASLKEPLRTRGGRVTSN